ncbi:MAG: CaiB/BaiF CoA transferase family protein [Candidatus Binatia bacterium]
MTKEEFYREANATGTGPLEGIVVLEACTTYAGPVAGAELADMGAEVIKCELPETGDICRVFGPRVPNAPESDRSAPFLSINRNKKSVTLNFHHPRGQEMFRQLARRADIVLENFRPGAMGKWHIGYENIRQVKPDIVYVSLSCLGQWGPLSHKVGYDTDAQAMSGIMSITGQADGPPTKVGNAIIDYLSGVKAAQAALAALVRRQRTGEGQWIDIAMVDSALSVTEGGIMQAAHCGEVWQRRGSRHPASAPCNSFHCADGEVMLAVAHDKQWQKLCQLIGRVDLIEDARTRSVAARKANEAFVEEVTANWIKDRSVREVVSVLNNEGISCSPILDFGEIVQEPHFRERESVCEVEHLTAGKLTHYGTAAKFSLTRTQIRTAAPLLGQHNADVYGQWLGLEARDLADLQREGVI